MSIAERINYDAISWGKPDKQDERLFAVRTMLWGPPSSSEDVWPIMEAGEHKFPFLCEMPLVNYPPSFHHHLVACHFTLIASFERPGIPPFLSEPCHIPYLPMLETCPSKQPVAYHRQIEVLQQHSIDINIPSLSVNVTGGGTLPVRLHVDDLSSITHVYLALNRHLHVSHGKYRRDETWLMYQQEQRLTNSVTDLLLPIPSVGPTVTYSNICTVKYTLDISVKVRKGYLSRKKQLVSLPLFFGTLDRGICTPANLMLFTDDWVARDQTLLTKPKFLRLDSEDDYLPPYDTQKPPAYAVP
ncbi:hypothetical protein EC973_009467 [Apophysomyces ossiformis]|uniref:Arrestin-like N-terminal domain-containing protein n=1 Tax=Apophysomyces ossiformis TaxID=679940 RepID=A0A8H7BMA0_9FUNG|nr:hypothetical protein EC973_009467 [Apophysomyces ossiformis]